MFKRKTNINYLKNHLDINILYQKTMTSTNDLGKKITDTPTLIICDKQTKGRGCNQRSFLSRKNKGIYMSLVTNHDINNYFNYITPITSVIVSLAIDKYIGRETSIKWINDIYLKNYKICGILTELSDHLIMGIGINLYKNKFKNIPNASSIESITGIKVPKELLIIDIINDLMQVLNNLNNQIIQELIAIYKSKSNLIGKSIFFMDTNKIYEVLDIDEECKLVLSNNDEIIKVSNASTFRIIE